LLHQFIYHYGLSLRNLCFGNKLKSIAAIDFFNVLAKHEFRLYVIILRARFCDNLLEGMLYIKKKLIALNGCIILNKYQNLLIGNLVQKRFLVTKRHCFYYKHLWRRFRWYQARYRLKQYRRYFSYYKLLRKNIVVNYLEINLIIHSCIILRVPLFGELILNQKKRMFNSMQVKALYYLY